MKISRKDESKLPEFDSHAMAREYFKNRYGDHFVMMSSEMIGEQMVYFYGLILNRKIYEDGVRRLALEGGFSDALDFMNSYQPIEIFEDGRIHIIH